MSKRKSKVTEKTDVLCSKLIAWTPHAWNEYLFWQKQDTATVNKINDLLAACLKDPLKTPISSNHQERSKLLLAAFF